MISILTVTYGNRFVYLEQVLQACISEFKNNQDKLYEIIIIDNASNSTDKIKSFILSHPNIKIKYIVLETNTGSAGGFSAGLKYFLNSLSKYILLLDDDNVPSKNFTTAYLSTLNLFPTEQRNNIVLLGRRNYVEIKSFYKRKKIPHSPKYLFGYNLFNPKTFFMLFKKHFIKRKANLKPSNFVPIYAEHGLAYGGAFIPKNIIKKVGFPSEYFFTYADDAEYGTRMIKSGFNIYQIYTPLINDIDNSNREEGYLSVLSNKVSDFRAFYIFRNNTYITLHTYKANIFIMLVNSFLYLTIINIIYIFKHGFSNALWKRNKLIIRAIKAGVRSDFSQF